MRTIALVDINGMKTVEAIRLVVERAVPADGRGLTIPEIRARCRVLEAIERLNGADELCIGETDYLTLVNALNSFQFGAASLGLLRIIDSILEAKDATA